MPKIYLVAIDKYQEMDDSPKVWNLGQNSEPTHFGDERILKRIKERISEIKTYSEGDFESQVKAENMGIDLAEYIGQIVEELHPHIDVGDCHSVVAVVVPDGALNIRLFYARNGNEELTYELDGKTTYAEIVPWDKI